MSEGEQQKVATDQESEQQPVRPEEEGDQIQQKPLPGVIGTPRMLVEILRGTELYDNLQLNQLNERYGALDLNSEIWYTMMWLSPTYTNVETYRSFPDIVTQTETDTMVTVTGLIVFQRYICTRMRREIEFGLKVLSEMQIQATNYERVYGSIYSTDKFPFTITRFNCLVPGTYVTALHHELAHWLRIFANYHLEHDSWTDEESLLYSSVVSLQSAFTQPRRSHPASLNISKASRDGSSSSSMQVVSEPALHLLPTSDRSTSTTSSGGKLKQFSLSDPLSTDMESSAQPQTTTTSSSDINTFDRYEFYPATVEINQICSKIDELQKELSSVIPILYNEQIRSPPNNSGLARRFEYRRDGSESVASESVDEVSDLPDD